MNAAMKYTLGRLGLFLLVLLVLWPWQGISLPMKLLVALVVSFGLSWFLLRGWRDRMSADLAARVERRRAEKAKLRAALAGEDEQGEPGERDAQYEPGRQSEQNQGGSRPDPEPSPRRRRPGPPAAPTRPEL